MPEENRAANWGDEADSVREPGDDFFCRRFRVWYASFDCAVRTYHHTCEGCLRCDQGRFNLRRHRVAVARTRFVALVPAEPDPEPRCVRPAASTLGTATLAVRTGYKRLDAGGVRGTEDPHGA